MANKGTSLTANQFLMRNDWLQSAHNTYQLLLQDDGNLVLYRLLDHEALWASGTAGSAGFRAIMQEDGNFVLYGYLAPYVLWASNTAGRQNSFLIVQDDGNVVIYEPNVPVWATNTSGR